MHDARSAVFFQMCSVVNNFDKNRMVVDAVQHIRDFMICTIKDLLTEWEICTGKY